ncbi:hypothetical protein MtrunA17_Chr1g0201281 [Medicago truncatula]|uniref:Uncharacterized protein n=1 Tax=Medicago truncatula TaxID=3880 RepID=A0A396JZQ3_MEDTR|nr:uncharacterized protein LOC112419182 [Medicago truncatula]RHN81633.1 hypothetical protein MtrunA17_Chr1g0201281 [Medicago truncatula]
MEKCDEFLKLMNDLKALRIDTEGGDTTTLENLNKQFIDFKLRLNSSEEDHELHAEIDRLESMIKLYQLKIKLHQSFLGCFANMKECRDELCKLMAEPKALRIDPIGFKDKLQDLYERYKGYKLMFNSLLQEYQITYHERFQGESEFDDLEPLFQFVFDTVEKKLRKI